ncbi:hypothetical protein CYMTET_32721 [Cymbomonas tetramitiformis]|uniref:Uncharacterized protein n=1 Tax=Cymbomonas tetramitiformis TaxID=36881 RepID=A0AAE0KRM4_9CHLO|nr:hypothetical protein CYMTET_32721 [Cymbomonas tetramitiformis]
MRRRYVNLCKTFVREREVEKDGECLVGDDAEWEERGGEAVEVPSSEVGWAQPETGPEDSGAAGGDCDDVEASAVAATDVVESQDGTATETETEQLGVEDDALQSPREDMCLQPADGTGEEAAPSSGGNARARRRAPHQAERDAERRQGVKRRLEGCPCGWHGGEAPADGGGGSRAVCVRDAGEDPGGGVQYHVQGLRERVRPEGRFLKERDALAFDRLAREENDKLGESKWTTNFVDEEGTVVVADLQTRIVFGGATPDAPRNSATAGVAGGRDGELHDYVDSAEAARGHLVCHIFDLAVKDAPPDMAALEGFLNADGMAAYVELLEASLFC